jgi:hypothetical protein
MYLKLSPGPSAINGAGKGRTVHVVPNAGCQRATGSPIFLIRLRKAPFARAAAKAGSKNEASLDKLLAWSSEPGLLPRVPSGPDRGKGWDRINDESLQELARDRDADIRFSAQTELGRRGERAEPLIVEPAQKSFI